MNTIAGTEFPPIEYYREATEFDATERDRLGRGMNGVLLPVDVDVIELGMQLPHLVEPVALVEYIVVHGRDLVA